MSPLLTTFTDASLRPFGFTTGGGPGTFELISTTVLGTAQANVQFSSIPSGYKHLQLRVVGRSSTAAGVDNLAFYLNGDTAANYSTHSLYALGTTPSSNNFTGVSRLYLPSQFAANTNTTNAFSAAIIDILEYRSTSIYKTIRAFTGVSGSSPVVSLVSGNWRSTSAITQINLECSANLTAGSRFSLYGVKG